METIHQRTTSAAQAGVHKPAGAAASVFEAGQMAKPPKVPRTYTVFDPSAVVIKKNAPIPPASRGSAGTDRYGALLQRMGEGDCVELTEKQAKSLQARARSLGVKTACRRVSDSLFGVWRLANEG